MPFQKGQSGNPAGRPRLAESLAERVRKLGGERGGRYLSKLHEIALAEGPIAFRIDVKEQLAALKFLIERGWGKAPQEIILEGAVRTLDAGAVANLTDEQLEALRAHARASAAILGAVTSAVATEAEAGE